MTLDPVLNFAKVTVSTGYDATATSIVLATGDGAKLPDPATDGAFNLVWWNDTDYKDPADDPNKEIVRCTARSTDTLTITRAQEGTTATAKNIAGKTYKMVLAVTRDTMDKVKTAIANAAPVNKGRYWVAHGNNVITFPNAHSNANYRWVVSLSQAPMGGITARNVGHTRRLSILTFNENTTRGKVRIEGGFGFSTGGYITAAAGTVQRFDDVANTHTDRTACTSNYNHASYSLNGYGFVSCGYNGVNYFGITERFDDITNAHTARATATARYSLAGYSLNGYGFTSCGYTTAVVGTTERFDDVANTHTARASATARRYLAGYSLNGYGFTSCGYTTANVGTTERFDDIANAHTARTAGTARHALAGYSLNGYGFTTCGYNGTYLGTTERLDDVANTHTARTAATARNILASYSLNGYGFSSCGYDGTNNLGTTERFDDVANAHTARATATARRHPAGYSLNEYFISYLTFNE